MLDIGYLWIFNRPPGWIHHGQRRQKGRQADLGRKGVAGHVAQLHGAQPFLLAATAQRGENVEIKASTWGYPWEDLWEYDEFCRYRVGERLRGRC